LEILVSETISIKENSIKYVIIGRRVYYNSL